MTAVCAANPADTVAGSNTHPPSHHTGPKRLIRVTDSHARAGWVVLARDIFGEKRVVKIDIIMVKIDGGGIVLAVALRSSACLAFMSSSGLRVQALIAWRACLRRGCLSARAHASPAYPPAPTDRRPRRVFAGATGGGRRRSSRRPVRGGTESRSRAGNAALQHALRSAAHHALEPAHPHPRRQVRSTDTSLVPPRPRELRRRRR